MQAVMETITLYRPVGQAEWDLIANEGFRAFPPRLPFQPIFYPVLSEEYAIQIARDWNTKDPASGYRGRVTRFAVRADFLANYEVKTVGSSDHQEYWIPAKDLTAFNAHLVGPIEMTAAYYGEGITTMQNVTIRRISKEQYLAAKELRLFALQDAPYAFSTTYEQASQRPDAEWEQMADARSAGNQDCTFLAYDSDGKAIGMAGGYRDPTNRERAHLVAMWTAPEWRGTGVAAELVETVCQWAAAIPAQEITAWVAEGNDRAIRFYNRLGFVTQPERGIFPPDPSKQEILTLRNLERKED